MDDSYTVEMLKQLLFLTPFLHKKIIHSGKINENNNFTPLQMQALYILYISNSMTMSQLASELFVSKQQCTAIINALSSFEYIDRMTNPKNRREVLISLTSCAKEYLDSVLNTLKTELYKNLDTLTDEDKKRFIESSKNIHEIMKKTI